MQDKISTHDRFSHSVFKEVDAEDFNARYDLRKISSGIRRHTLAILLSVIVFGLAGLYASYYLMTHYRAEAVVLFQREDEQEMKLPGGLPLTHISMSTVMDMIELPSNLQAVKSILGLNLGVEEIEEMVSVPQPKNDSNLIRIVANGDNPHLAVDVANTLAGVAVNKSEDFMRKQLKVALDSYRSQLDQVRQRLAAQIQDIEDFKKAHQYFEMDAQHSAILNRIMNARQLRDEAALKYNSQLIEYENLKRQLEQLPNYVSMSADAQGSPLQTRIMTLETALADAKSRYTKDNPKVKMLEEQLKELLTVAKSDEGEEEFEYYQRNPVKSELEVELMHLQGKVRSSQKAKQELTESLEKLEKELENLPSQQMALVKLLQSKQITEEQLKFMNNAVDSAQLMLKAPKGSLEIYHLAVKAKPLQGKAAAILIPLLAVIFGLGLGVVWAIALEMFDSKIRTGKEAGIFYSPPCLLTIPEIPFLSPYNGEEKTLFFIRQLHEQVEKLGPEAKSIAFLSSVEGEGKSTLSYYFANYHRKIGKRTILITWDSASKEAAGTLDQYLRGECEIDALIGKEELPRIGVEKNVPGMKELVKSERMQALVQELGARYDWIIFDVPSVIAYDFAPNIAKLADFPLFVIGSSIVSKSTVDDSLSALDAGGKRPAGILLNRVHPIYIHDERVKAERKRSSKWQWRDLFSRGG